MLGRLKTHLNHSAIFLILVNLIPIIGLIFFNYSIFSILTLYWLESLVIGFYSILKIIIAQRILPTERDIPKGRYEKVYQIIGIVLKIIVIPFFCLHYGAFLLGHLFFIVALTKLSDFLDYVLIGDIIKSLILPAIAIFISHGFSFITNYIIKKEYKEDNINSIMVSPYKRIAIMQITILAGGALFLFSKLPATLAIVLCLAKIYIDLKAHNKEHKFTLKS